MADPEEQVIKLEEEISIRDKQIEVLNQRIESLEKGHGLVKELEGKIHEYERQNEKLLDDKQDLNIRMTNLQKEFSGDKNSLHEKLKEKDKEIRSLNNQLRDLMEDDSLKKMQKHRDKLAKELKDMKESLSDKQKELDKKVAYYKKREGDKDSKIRSLEIKLEKAVDEKKSVVKKAETARDDYKRRYEDMKEKYDNSVKDNDELKTTNDRAESELRKLKSALKELEDKKKKQVEDLTEQNKNHAHVITFKEGKIVDLEKRINHLEKESLDKEEVIKHNEEKVSASERKMEREKARTESEKVKNSELRKEINRLRENLLKKDKEIRGMKVDYERWVTENQEMTKKFKEFAIQKLKHDEHYYTMEGKYEGMKKSLIEKDEWIVKISKELERKVRELEKARQINTNYKRRRILDLEKVIDEKDLEIKVLNQMIVSANKMVQVKSTEFKRIKRKLEGQNKIIQMMRQSIENQDKKFFVENFARISKDQRMTAFTGLTKSKSYAKNKFKKLRIKSSKTRSGRRFQKPLEKIPDSLLKRKEEVRSDIEEEINREDRDEKNPNDIINDVEAQASNVYVNKSRKMEDFKKLIDDISDESDN